ncbi:OCIA domain-containing protein 1 [Anabarilius grahami]|uniref:OCIA domain-containing protein 1 n=1 Tax=Anabarilius grahami TaxID=495550 RepID=A0A3N0XF41_ANAGA|nr:OCIA domain-containing protein 1 [Anabarilius grahami]
MSQQSPSDPERPRHAALGPVGIDYIPTEEERRVFRECNQESFWYRSLPISAISMAFTQFLISRGALMASGRFGSLPKVAFAGVCGFLGGKMSYMKTCQEKFKSLENSPLGEALRQRQHHQTPKFPFEQPGLSDPNKADLEPAFQLDDQRDFTYKSSYIEEDVRSKDTENYEVTMTQKPGALPKSSAESTPAKKGETCQNTIQHPNYVCCDKVIFMFSKLKVMMYMEKIEVTTSDIS